MVQNIHTISFNKEKRMSEKILIPEELRKEELRFCLVTPKDKKPFEKDWPNKPYKYNDERFFDTEKEALEECYDYSEIEHEHMILGNRLKELEKAGEDG